MDGLKEDLTRWIDEGLTEEEAKETLISVLLREKPSDRLKDQYSEDWLKGYHSAMSDNILIAHDVWSTSPSMC